MKINRFHWSLIIAGIILGLMLSLQFRTTRDIRENEVVRRTQELSSQVNQMKKEHDALQLQLGRMRSQLEHLTTGPQAMRMKEEIDRAGFLAGTTELTGKGVEVILKDSSAPLKPGDNPNLFVVHDEDILKVVNELRAAGAEAISVNGQRIVAVSEISCSGPTIRINKKPLAPPFVITAIGDPEILESSLKMAGGVLETLQFFGIDTSIKKLPQVTVPAYAGGMKFDYAFDEVNPGD